MNRGTTQVLAAVVLAGLVSLTACNKKSSSGGSTNQPKYQGLASAVFLSAQTMGTIRPHGASQGKCVGGGTVTAGGAITAVGTANPYHVTATASETFDACVAGNYTWTGSLSEAFNLNATLTPNPVGLPPTVPSYSMTSFSINGTITTNGTVNVSGGNLPSLQSCPVSNFVITFTNAGFNLNNGQESGTLGVSGSVCGETIPAGTVFQL